MSLPTRKGLAATTNITAAFSTAGAAASLTKHDLVNMNGANAAHAAQDLSGKLSAKTDILADGHQAIATLKATIAEASPAASANAPAGAGIGTTALGIAAEMSLSAIGLPAIGTCISGLAACVDTLQSMKNAHGQGTMVGLTGSNDWASLTDEKESGFNYSGSNDLGQTSSAMSEMIAAPSMLRPDQMFASYADYTDASAFEVAAMERKVRELEVGVHGATLRAGEEGRSIGHESLDYDQLAQRDLQPEPEFIKKMTMGAPAPAFA